MKDGNLPRTVGLVSLGCSKNRVDSEMLLGLLAAEGIAPVADPREAELIVVNTCGFIESAKEESIDAILEMAAYKKRSGGKKLLFVTGCLSQRYGEELKKELPEVDGFLGVAEYPNLIKAIREAAGGKRPLLTGECARFLNGPRILTTPSYSAYVKISDGCNNRCSYCAIPLIRGAYRSRPEEEILSECERLSEAGASELTLIAQDTSRYGNDFPAGRLLLPELLEKMNAMPRLHWARVLYCYPDTVNEYLLDAIQSLPKVAPYLDLPLQHCNDQLLRRMNRRGSRRMIESLLDACRARGITVRTTMIVGFPGETDAMFEELLDFVKAQRFARLGAFSYSPEEGTLAAEMPDQLPEEVKRERLNELMLLQQGISLEINESRVGKIYEVLTEGFEDGLYYGRSLLEAPEVDGNIRFRSEKTLKPGEYLSVRATDCDAYDLMGETV